MAFCTKCGATIPDNSNVCPSCGAVQTNQDNQQQSFNSASPAADGDYTSQMDPMDISANKGMSVLAYFGLLFLVPLLAAPNSQFARFHTNQGLILFIVDMVAGVIAGILSIIPFVGGILSGVLVLCITVLMILGIVNAAQGKAKELPLIGKFRILK